MRRLLTIPLAAALVAACTGPVEPPQPLDGRWVLDTSTAGLPPRQMTLSQHGTSVTGSGTAMGVDAPIPITVTGTYSPSIADRAPVVTLHLVIADGGGVTADFAGTVSPQGRIDGTVTYAGDAFVSGELAWVRAPAAATGLEGVVTRGPVTPVCRVGVPCDAPFSAGFTVLRGNAAVARFWSDSAGRYDVLLPPGGYDVMPDSGAPVWPVGQAKAVAVGSVGMTRVDLAFDTGIR